MRGNPHAAFDESGAGNVAGSRCCDTRMTERASNREHKLRPTPINAHESAAEETHANHEDRSQENQTDGALPPGNADHRARSTEGAIRVLYSTATGVIHGSHR